MEQAMSLRGVVAVALLGATCAWAESAPQKMTSVEYLVGSWNCAHTVGEFSGTYKTSYAKVLGGVWLRQTYEFPPRQFGDNEPPVNAEFLIGYDERRQAWVRFGAISTGQYFAIRMTDTPNGGWSYKYVSFFNRQQPETSDSDATFTKRSDSEYIVDGPSYPANGVRVTEHHVCRKQ
jgi:hypothetical protein